MSVKQLVEPEFSKYPSLIWQYQNHPNVCQTVANTRIFQMSVIDLVILRFSKRLPYIWQCQDFPFRYTFGSSRDEKLFGSTNRPT